MSKKKNSTSIKLVAIFSAVFTVLILLLYFAQFSVGLSFRQSDWASFGAFIGGTLGTFFAFASFAILLYSFNSQQKQAKNNEIQKFETTFYSLLELHNRSLSELESKIDEYRLDKLFNIPVSIHSRVREYEDYFVENEDNLEEKNLKALREYLKHTQDDILRDIEISQYFRILYQLLKFVAKYNVGNINYEFDDEYLDNRDNISQVNEKMYTSLIRGFLPEKFLPVLALHCIPSDEGLHNLTKYRRLLERYSFLEHIQLHSLPNNLCIFLILEGYSSALGKNKDIKDKVREIRLRFPQLSEINSMNNGYLLK